MKIICKNVTKKDHILREREKKRGEMKYNPKNLSCICTSL